MLYISHCTVSSCSLRGFFTLRFALVGLNRYQVASNLALSNYFRDQGERVVEICLEIACWKTILIKEVASNRRTIS